MTFAVMLPPTFILYPIMFLCAGQPLRLERLHFDANGMLSRRCFLVFQINIPTRSERCCSARNSSHYLTGCFPKIPAGARRLIYVEACQHRLILHTIQGDFTTRCTFTDLTVCLTPSDRFFHGGKGLLINFAHVSLVQVTGEILLKNGQIIFCSRRRRRETREAFLVYAGAGKFSYETI